VDLRESYERVRAWYQKHCDTALQVGDEHRKASVALIRALPPASAMSELEIIAVFREVCLRKLEWAYGAGEDGAEMARDTRAILEALGRLGGFSSEEVKELRKSSLWPFIEP